MFQLSDFYGYCKQNDVDVMPFAMLPRAACTVRDGQNYAVVLNFKRLHTVRQMRTAMLHESGHLHTGALHKVDSPFQLVAGYTEPWQLAEYFDLDEDYIKKALHYWTQCRGVDFNQ